ncbi:hypothetical protein UFOVP1298_32 [uncultured Caudovirales phage]|uniref:Uncharacterized protein n=1 Tax=uncultured Caudovirales phage TaxID=2100421 RepID=A0A6J5RUM1_9CAUD|nr:hypothetical protein UFOVP1298_32 [uncultured Caudovirales phage]
MTSTETSNLELWNASCSTDPRYTKSFTRGGGFSGTAINNTYLIRKATEMWGPMGGKWGVQIIEQGLMPGAPMTAESFEEVYGYGADQQQVIVSKKSETKVIGHEQIHFVRIKLFYPTSTGAAGAVEHFGQTTFVGSNKRGFFTDEEAPKKSLTDAISKALSMIGFSADVYLGLFDDNKYVNDAVAKAAAAQEKTAEIKVKAAEIKPKVTSKDLVKTKESLASCKTVEDLRKVYASLSAELKAITLEYTQALAKGME